MKFHNEKKQQSVHMKQKYKNIIQEGENHQIQNNDYL